MQKAAFIDLDKTIYDGYLAMDWALDLKKRGAIKYSLIYAIFKGLGIIYNIERHKYTKAMTILEHEISKVLDGKSFEEINKITDEFLDTVQHKYYSYTSKLIEILKNKGFKIIFVTAEPDFLAELIKKDYEADDALGFDLTTINGLFIKKPEGPSQKAADKGEVITGYAQKNGYDLQQSIALGDSEGDISMLKAVGTGILLNPNGYLRLRIIGSKVISCRRDKILNLVEGLA